MKKIIFFLTILTFSIISLSADTDGYLNVTNDTGFTIAAIFVSDSDKDDWGDDYLNGRVLNNGETLKVRLENISSTTVNVRGRDDEGDTYTVYGIYAVSDDVLLTLSDIDPD